MLQIARCDYDCYLLESTGVAKGGVRNRNKGGCKRLFVFVRVGSRLLTFACYFASAFACICQRLSVFVCICSHLLAPPFVSRITGLALGGSHFPQNANKIS